MNGQLVFLDPPFGSGISGGIDFFSGPLLSLVIGTDPSGNVTDAAYAYAPGQFMVLANWMTPEGETMTGNFVAPLLNLSIGTCEGDCFDGFATGEFTASLGPGLFDPLLAYFLGVSRRSSGGTFAGGLDFIEGDPSSSSRLAGAPSPWDVTITTVPEPGMGALSLLAVASLWLRRRRATASPLTQGPSYDSGPDLATPQGTLLRHSRQVAREGAVTVE